MASELLEVWLLQLAIPGRGCNEAPVSADIVAGCVKGCTEALDSADIVADCVRGCNEAPVSADIVAGCVKGCTEALGSTDTVNAVGCSHIGCFGREVSGIRDVDPVFLASST
jgi:hypothetical protein